MPIEQEIAKEITGAPDVVRRRYLTELADYTERDTLIYAMKGIASILPDDVTGFMTALHDVKGKELDLIIHSPGGSLEGAEKIVQYLRTKYDHIRAIVPLTAMSAATMLACACDVIVMGKHSSIGPIDPQINVGGFSSPAQSIKDEFEQAKADIASNQQLAALWAPKFKQYPLGLLKLCDNAIQLSETLVEQWLNSYMFKDHSKPKPGKKIAKWLGATNKHYTHGRPISAQIASEHGLIIELLEEQQEFQERVLSVFHAISLTFQVTSCVKIIENHQGKGWYLIPPPQRS